MLTIDNNYMYNWIKFSTENNGNGYNASRDILDYVAYLRTGLNLDTTLIQNTYVYRDDNHDNLKNKVMIDGYIPDGTGPTVFPKMTNFPSLANGYIKNVFYSNGEIDRIVFVKMSYPPDDGELYPAACVAFDLYDNGKKIIIRIVGDSNSDEVNDILKDINYNCVVISDDENGVVSKYNYVYMDEDGDIDYKRVYLYDSDKYPKDSFYPFIAEHYPTVNDFINDYLESDESILLLTGDPGTGKTTLIKQILRTVYSDDCNPIVISDPRLIKRNVIPIIIRQIEEAKKNLIVIEDADVLIGRKRIEGNMDLSSLLNVSDGLAPKNKYPPKIIMTTNITDIEHMDSALIRPGRCFGVVHFRPLTIPESKLVLSDINSDKVLDTTKGSYTLAELVSNTRDIGSVRRF